MAQVKEELEEFTSYLCLLIGAVGVCVAFVSIMRLLRAVIILITFLKSLFGCKKWQAYKDLFSKDTNLLL